MAQAERPSNGTQTRQSGGCMRTCLITSLIIVIVLAATGIAIYFGGRAYLARRLPEWQARYPALGIATSLLQLRGEMTASETEPLAGPGRQGGTDDRSLLSDDILMPTGAVVETFSISNIHITGYQRFTEPYEAILARVHENMSQNGWELVADEEIAEGMLLVWQKSERNCHIEVATYQGSSELWLRCSGEG